MRFTAVAVVVTCLAVTGCHRSRGISLQDIEAEVRAMERAVVERTLLTLFPDADGWLVLPPQRSAAEGEESAFLAAYRVVAPDSLPADTWIRFLRGGERVELLEVSGSTTAPLRTDPVGFRGLMVRFSTAGVEASALLVDPGGMRWVVWYETTNDCAPPCPDSLALAVADYLAGSRGAPPDEDAPVGCRFYPPLPEPVIEPESLWTMARRGAAPRLKWLPDSAIILPDLTIGRRLIAAAPPDPLSDLDPFLLQRRLDQCGGPRIVLSRSRPLLLTEGTYFWAVSTLGQARAVRVGSSADAPVCAGHSAVLFGRPVAGAGTLRVDGSGGMEADAFPGEYGLSPFQASSVEVARQSGTRFFPRVGRLLGAMPGPEEGTPWPSLRTAFRSGPCASTGGLGEPPSGVP